LVVNGCRVFREWMDDVGDDHPWTGVLEPDAVKLASPVSEGAEAAMLRAYPARHGGYCSTRTARARTGSTNAAPSLSNPVPANRRMDDTPQQEGFR
jgi:hypothetical protein